MKKSRGSGDCPLFISNQTSPNTPLCESKNWVKIKKRGKGKKNSTFDVRKKTWRGERK